MISISGCHTFLESYDTEEHSLNTLLVSAMPLTPSILPFTEDSVKISVHIFNLPLNEKTYEKMCKLEVPLKFYSGMMNYYDPRPYLECKCHFFAVCGAIFKVLNF